jgi:DUF1365 family protein
LGSRIAQERSAAGAVYVGEVVHRRARPRRHVLRYRVYSLLVDLDRLEAGDSLPRFLSFGRPNLFSFSPRDFGARDGTSIAAFVRARAREAGLAEPVARIEMLAYPRVLGFAFNPITVYFLYDAAGAVRMLLHEVRNTFGEHHFYAALTTADADGALRHSADKAFYVSPFNSVEGTYRFTVRSPQLSVFVGIVLTTDAGGLVTAYFDGDRRPLDDRQLLKLALEYPFMTAKVVLGIHWEALRLWLKGVPPTLSERSVAKATRTARH